ncbi:restriction endonuclease subunit S [Caldifermentibacillus hisashii]|uniref:restriction endonuclease subunit S n=1 Tax=Caldifermentibacillus hisashii TaxID=996558 RepID=UPI0031FCAF6B
MKIISLGSLVKIRTGKLDANANDPNGKYPFFTCSREALKINSYTYDCECVLVAGNGDLNVKYYNGKFDAYQRTYILESLDKKTLNVKYLYYFMERYVSKLRKMSIGGVIKYIKLSYLTEAKIPLPDLKVQNKIVEVLDKAQYLISKRKSQIEALDQLTQSVFLEMFGDPYKNPKNWPVGTIKDITLKTQYGTSKKASENKGKYPILRMGNITYNGFLDFNDMKYIDLDDSEAEKYLVHKGDLLFNRTNSKELVGKTAVYREELPMAYAGYLVKLVPNEKANSEFISGFLNSKYGKTLLYSMAKNIVGMANINAEELKRIKIYIPPRDLQDKFASIISNILERRELLNKGLKLLEENYNSLMQRAFKGELFTEEKVSNL